MLSLQYNVSSLGLGLGLDLDLDLEVPNKAAPNLTQLGDTILGVPGCDQPTTLALIVSHAQDLLPSPY